MKKMKKILIMLMVAVIAITVIPFNFSSASTNHGPSLITNVTLDKTTASLGEKIQVNYNWAIPDGTVKAGDTMIVKMPAELKLEAGLDFDLKDAQGNVVGRAKVNPTTNEITVTFTDYAESRTNVHGDMRVWVQVDRSANTSGEQSTINFPTKNGNVQIGLNISDNGVVGPPPTELPANVLAKWGEVDANDPTLINWTVLINYDKLTIPNAVYTDTIGAGHTFIRDSLAVYKGNTDNQGNPIASNKLADAVIENMLINSNSQGFQLALGNINDTVSVTYQTKMANPVTGQAYRNEAKLTGTDVSESKKSEVKYFGGDGSGTGETPPTETPDLKGSIEIIKRDATNHSKLLAGAEFRLESTVDTERTLVTDSSGKARLDNLALGTYRLVETKAPNGYILDATARTFQITADNHATTMVITVDNQPEPATEIPPTETPEEPETETPPVEIPEEPETETETPDPDPIPEPDPTGSIQLRKVDAAATNKTLAGATYHLLNAAGTPIKTVTTVANGTLTINDLALGKYSLVEVTAPSGYILDKTPIAFEITAANAGQMITLTHKNTKIDVPEIHKNVAVHQAFDWNIMAQLEGAPTTASQSLELTNRDDSFVWNVDTKFGNNTATWTKAVLTDQINDLLEIENIQITDAQGNDVTGNGTLTEENNLITFTINKKNNSYAFLSGQTYTMNIQTKIKDGVTDEQLAPFIQDGGIPNQAELAFNNSGKIVSEIPKVTPPPVNPEISKDIEGKEHLELANRNDAFDWNIHTAFGNQTASWNQAIITDQINNLLAIENIQITDENGNDVTENGTITEENNLITFTMNKKDDSFAYLAGHTYTMTVTTTIKEGVTDEQLAPFIQDGGIPNQADLAFGNEGDNIQSEIPTVTPPPVNPEISKDIEGKEHLDLTNRNDAFNWNVHTAFGNQTASWNQAIITDQINDVLAIENIQITDENGNDVTENGTITEDNNLITFTMNKKDDSFAYLAGHTYTMTVTTTIKQDVTDEQLAPFIQDGGIPNQAELAFANEGDMIQSEIPTVTPPTPAVPVQETPENPSEETPKTPENPTKETTVPPAKETPANQEKSVNKENQTKEESKSTKQAEKTAEMKVTENKEKDNTPASTSFLPSTGDALEYIWILLGAAILFILGAVVVRQYRKA
ncbi:isopeptide-forming domain-containing fimbrial protein [Paenilisteria newyorkensis]|uniref:isopeptide-forming domain-containing fimbrial protein n=1 Tax=Listeria newyorkensis TaxID=1497681 RepID=UPI0010F6E2DA|nr:isopeptide-forming domain-containing fimbrial protein [Listeria newyorkensis]WAO22654.2 isopeptide-forming domain-containing fimbrial protein [Listeria newyorkensis]